MAENGRARLAVDGVGLAAVLAGLVFVGAEVRQNTAATRAATQQAIFDATIQAHWGVIENARLREVMVLARDDPSWVTATPQTGDHILLERFYWQRFNQLENVFYHHLEGNLDPRLWRGWEVWIQSVADDPVMAHYWGKLGDGYMPELAEYMDQVLRRSAQN